MQSHHHYKLRQKIKKEVAKAKLPPYQGGPGVDYTKSAFAYAVDIALLHLPPDPVTGLANEPKPSTHILLVQRGCGHGIIGSWSGVSGYIDTIADPTGKLTDDIFDPIIYTVKNELNEECGLDYAIINEIDFHLGAHFTVEKFGGGVLHIVPVLGIHKNPDKPIIIPHPQEIAQYQWVSVASVKRFKDIAPNFCEQTLPNALAAFGSQMNLLKDNLDAPSNCADNKHKLNKET